MSVIESVGEEEAGTREAGEWSFSGLFRGAFNSRLAHILFVLNYQLQSPIRLLRKPGHLSFESHNNLDRRGFCGILPPTHQN